MAADRRSKLKRGIGHLMDVIDRDVAILLRRTQKDKETIELIHQWSDLLEKELDVLTQRDQTAARLRQHVDEGDPLSHLFAAAVDLTSQRIGLIMQLIVNGTKSLGDQTYADPNVTAHLQSLRERVMNKLF
jgi:hypothetical protein